MQKVKIRIPKNETECLDRLFQLEVSDKNFYKIQNEISGSCTGKLTENVDDYPFLYEGICIPVIWTSEHTYPVAAYQKIASKLLHVKRGDIISGCITEVHKGYLTVSYKDFLVKCPFKGYLNELKLFSDDWQKKIKKRIAKVIVANAGKTFTGLILKVEGL